MSNPNPHLYDNSCLDCINNGFYWFNNNCRDYYNNTSDVTLETHNNGTTLCPMKSSATIIKTNISAIATPATRVIGNKKIKWARN
jgi:hypothetical protein